MTQRFQTVNENEIEIVLTIDEIERLLHDVNNRSCAYLCSTNGAAGESPWESIRLKLLQAIRSR